MINWHVLLVGLSILFLCACVHVLTCWMVGVGDVHIHVHMYVRMYVIAGVDPDPFTQATKTILSGLAINLASLH